jgi:hypothetical protein
MLIIDQQLNQIHDLLLIKIKFYSTIIFLQSNNLRTAMNADELSMAHKSLAASIRPIYEEGEDLTTAEAKTAKRAREFEAEGELPAKILKRETSSEIQLTDRVKPGIVGAINGLDQFPHLIFHYGISQGQLNDILSVIFQGVPEQILNCLSRRYVTNLSFSDEDVKSCHLQYPSLTSLVVVNYHFDKIWPQTLEKLKICKLNIYFERMQETPLLFKNVTCLKTLETLNIKTDAYSSMLPDFSAMSSLKKLSLKICDYRKNFTDLFTQLTNLRALSLVIDESCKTTPTNEDFLMLTHLKKFHIQKNYGFKESFGMPDVIPDEILPCFTNLKSLCVAFKTNWKSENIKLLTQLEKIKIYNFNQNPVEIVQSLPNLTSITIPSRSIPAFNEKITSELTNLTELQIHSAIYDKTVIHCDWAFLTCLKQLKIIDMKNMRDMKGVFLQPINPNSLTVLTNLMHLNMFSKHINEISVWDKLTNLESVGDQLFSVVRTIDAEKEKLPAKCAEFYRKFRELKNLILPNEFNFSESANDKSFNFLEKMTVNLNHKDAENELKHICKLTNLKALTLIRGTELSSENMQFLKEKLPNTSITYKRG